MPSTRLIFTMVTNDVLAYTPDIIRFSEKTDAIAAKHGISPAAK